MSKKKCLLHDILHTDEAFLQTDNFFLHLQIFFTNAQNFINKSNLVDFEVK